MVDPFSITAGTVGLVDVGWRTIKYLQDVQAAANKVEEEIAALSHQIKALLTVNDSIRAFFEAESENFLRPSTADAGYKKDLWRNTGNTLTECRAIVEKLDVLLREIVGKEGPKVLGRLDGFRKQMRKQSKNQEFNRLRNELSINHDTLQVLLAALNLDLSSAHKSRNAVDVDHLSDNVQILGLSLRSQIASLRPTIALTGSTHLHSSLKSAGAVASSISLNKHFSIPQSVSSIFTGREKLLEDLKDAFDTVPSPGHKHTQKRYVIFGLGGSGKTQFCCKFAQDNQENFWGIFWIDASSHESAKHTFSRIAMIGGVEPNERAAKSWLSSLDYPWLLIIDGADDPRADVDKYFPEGKRGHILVTTRNPASKVHGTVGSGSSQFEMLETEEANNLLLKAACEPSPWNSTAKISAALISEALGFLPIALVHAGTAIMNHLCTLGNYLDYYKRNWGRIRRARRISGPHGDEQQNLNVYSSYDVLYQGLEVSQAQEAKDAVELLKTFSFLYCENIRVDVLVKAATNPRIEREEQKNEKISSNTTGGFSKPRLWTKTLKGIALGISGSLLKNRAYPVLPAVLRDIEVSGSFDGDRLRVALQQLTQFSLITHHTANDSYSMHPLVHTWVRERPQMSTAEQAIWCHAAGTTLTQCILLPPLGSTEADEDIRRDLLPHIDHVQKCEQEITTRISDNQKLRTRPWPVLTPSIDRGQALQLAKFSRVYSQCGRWDEAERLQLAVKNYVCGYLGLEHPVAMGIMLALSGTYWQQTRGNEAAELQNQVLQACIAALGEDHERTLKVMDLLGQSRCYQGRFKEALALHQKAIQGMTKILGASHEDTLRATDNLGRVYHRYFRFEEARDCHAKAFNGMQIVLGPTHLDTLIAMDSLAMTYLEIGGELLKTAHELMLQVVEERKKKLGKEQPYTLLAICNLGRIKSALGDMNEAETLIRAALPIAERNLGKDHFGPLSGRVHLANVVVRQKRYGEAEAMFLDVVQRQRYESSARESGEHPDRIMAMWYLLQCYQVQGKFEDALRIHDEIAEGLSSIGGDGHPFAGRLQDKQTTLLNLRAASRNTIGT